MAEENQQESAVMGWAKGVVEAVKENAYLGGQLQAAFRQGGNELGAALKAFPDSIQIDEPGTVLNPLYRDRDGETPAHPYGASQESAASMHGLPTPDQIANARADSEPSQDQGHEHGQDNGARPVSA
jgi:hypothetical protein